MPIESPTSSFPIPAEDLWSFLFERSDRSYPDNHAIQVDTVTKQCITFQSLQQTSQRFGRGLKQHLKWQKGDIMVLCTPNSIESAAVTFGTLWAGGVICPVNYLLKVGELVHLLKSSRAKAITTHAECLETVLLAASKAGIPRSRIFLLGGPDTSGSTPHFSCILSDDMQQQKTPVNPEQDLAFLVFSSGTTGMPKGVMLTHRNMVANTLQCILPDDKHWSWSGDRVLGFLPMYHIYGVMVLTLMPIYRGATIYVMPRFELQKFCEVIEEQKITFAYLVPPVGLALAKHPLVDKYDMSSLRMLHSSAAPLAPELIRAIHRRLNVKVKQGYGLSEASPGVSSQSWEDWYNTAASSGYLQPLMSAKVVQHGEEVPLGVQGELWIRGPNVFKGYLDNPKATAETIDSEGWLHTGDVAYADETGQIYITDRVKELIKYNGFQVVPAELEALLQGHPAVDDVAVIGVPNAERATELVRAYIVCSPEFGESVTLERELSDWVKERVAPYKQLRGGIRFVREIPKSTAGKVLRRVLLEQAKAEYTMPSARL